MGNLKQCFEEEKEALTKTKSHEVFKSCLVRIVTDSDPESENICP